MRKPPAPTVSPLPRPVFLSAEVAAILHQKPKTLEVWRWKSKATGVQHGPPVTRIGRLPLYEEQALYRWVAEQSQAPRSPRPPGSRPTIPFLNSL